MVDDGNSKKPSPLNKAFFPNWTATTKQPISKSHWNRLNYTLPHASYFKELCTKKVNQRSIKVNPQCGARIEPSLYQWKAFTLTICTTGSSPSGFKRPPRLPKCGLRGIVRNTLPMLMAPAWGGHLYPHTKTMCLKIPYIEKFILRQHQLLTDLKIYPTH